jgi:hypothetical protein
VNTAVQLLKLLGSGVRPVESALTQARAALGAGEAAFSKLLDQARSGELSSHKVVSVDDDAKVELSDQELARLSLAADKAEAEGVRTALVIFDDKQVLLDVSARKVTGTAPFARGGAGQADGDAAAGGGAAVLSGVDGVIDLSTKLTPAEQAKVLGTPSASPAAGASLAKLLEQLDQSKAAAGAADQQRLAG